MLWHLKLCLRLLDKLGYQLSATYVSSAIDTLTREALSDGEISEMDLAKEERVRLALELFEKHGSMDTGGVDSVHRGKADD